jgi:hypothetical protein
VIATATPQSDDIIGSDSPILGATAIAQLA